MDNFVQERMQFYLINCGRKGLAERKGLHIFAPQAQFQSVGVWTKAQDDVRVECLLACLLDFLSVELSSLTSSFVKPPR